MAKEGVEHLIAKRCAGARGNQGLMEQVAAIAVALSIIVMIITIAVVMGFKREVESRLTALSGDMIVTRVGALPASMNSAIVRSREVEAMVESAAQSAGVGVKRSAPFVLSSAILRSSDAAEGVVMKGIDGSYDIEMLKRSVLDGEMPDFAAEKTTRNAMISRMLASEMELAVGDKLELLVPTSVGHGVKRELYRVGAIFSAGIGEGERRLVIVDMRAVQRVKRWSANEVSGYEVWIDGPDPLNAAAKVAILMNHALRYLDEEDSAKMESIAAYDTKRLYPSLFDWLAAHDINGLVILIIMVIVAAFNIITAMLVMVLERTQMVGILKALGMNNSSVRRIFLYRAIRVTIRGVVWGNVIGVGLALLQEHFAIVKLDEEGYLLSVLPVELNGWMLLTLNITVVAMIALLATLPTRFATTIEPTKAIKYQ